MFVKHGLIATKLSIILSFLVLAWLQKQKLHILSLLNVVVTPHFLCQFLYQHKGWGVVIRILKYQWYTVSKASFLLMTYVLYEFITFVLHIFLPLDLV